MSTKQARSVGSARVGAVVASIALLGACSSSSAPGIYADWEYVSGTIGDGLNLKADGTYEASILALTSSDSANAAVETGTFTADGSTLTLTPQKSSCRGPDPAYSAGYTLTGGQLELTFPSVARVYSVDTSAAGPFSLTFGCFDSNGAFTASPLANVSGGCAGGPCGHGDSGGTSTSSTSTSEPSLITSDSSASSSGPSATSSGNPSSASSGTVSSSGTAEGGCYAAWLGDGTSDGVVQGQNAYPCYCEPGASLTTEDLPCGGLCTLGGSGYLLLCQCEYGQEVVIDDPTPNVVNSGGFRCEAFDGSAGWAGQWPIGTP